MPLEARQAHTKDRSGHPHEEAVESFVRVFVYFPELIPVSILLRESRFDCPASATGLERANAACMFLLVSAIAMAPGRWKRRGRMGK